MFPFFFAVTMPSGIDEHNDFEIISGQLYGKNALEIKNKLELMYPETTEFFIQKEKDAIPAL